MMLWREGFREALDIDSLWQPALAPEQRQRGLVV